MTQPILIIVISLLGAGELAAPPAEGGPAPDGWQTYAVRAEIAPAFRVEGPDGAAASPGAYRLGLAGGGNDAVDGRWVRDVDVRPGAHYRFAAEYRARGVANPSRSVLARVTWLDAQGRPTGAQEYPVIATGRSVDGWTALAGTYQAPARAERAKLELHLRWAARGDVLWRGAGLTESAPPEPRPVRLAAIHHRPSGMKTSRENLDQFAPLVDEAGRRKADIVCLPEGITVIGTGRTYADVSEPIPGPSTRFLGDLAKRNRLYLVAGLYERDGTTLYNTSVLIGRDGALVGKYRKVCLPRAEVDGGLTPGTAYPVFDTDFGKVGMMICWDVQFPEVARELAIRGAEVVLMPIWGGSVALTRARAIENQVYLVTSGYDFKTTIYDLAGEPLASAASDPSVLVTEVDLNQRHPSPRLGDFRSVIWREGPPR